MSQRYQKPGEAGPDGSPALLSVNVGLPRTIPGTVAGEERPVRTAIFKQAAPGRVALGRLGLSGDGQADRRHHGGPDRALYAYPFEHYDHWSRYLERSPLPYGFFGENLTTRGLLEADVHMGDAFRIGSATVQVSGLRAPCFKLGLRTEAPHIVRPFLQSGRLGFYLRVLEEGLVGAGDTWDLVEPDAVRVSVAEFIRLVYEPSPPAEALVRALQIESLSADLRATLEKRRSTAE